MAFKCDEADAQDKHPAPPAAMPSVLRNHINNNNIMKYFFLITLLSLILVHQACGQKSSKKHTDVPMDKAYVNETYRFSVIIPNNWKLYGELKNDSLNHMAIVDWGLPKIYSKLEKTEIENSVSISAYNRIEVNSIEKLITFDYLRINPNETALEVDKDSPNARMIYTTTSTGIKYKGKCYYIFKNGIGYVITFMATPGTYDKNIKVFENFYKQVKTL